MTFETFNRKFHDIYHWNDRVVETYTGRMKVNTLTKNPRLRLLLYRWNFFNYDG